MSTHPSPNRRPALACLLLLIAAGCGPSPDPKGREVAEWVLSKGGELTLEDDEDVDEKEELPDENGLIIRRIALPENDVTDQDLARFTDLKNLRRLNLYGNPVTDAGIEALAGLKQLQTVELSYTRVTKASLDTLGKLPDVQRIYVRGTAVTAEEAKDFQTRYPDVEVLYR